MTSLLMLFYFCKAQNNFLTFIPPSAYGGISSVFIESNKTLYFHSGIGSDGGFLVGLQTFYYDDYWKAWRSTELAGFYYPDGRSYYGSFYYDNNYYIFGGIGLKGSYNDMWKYDTTYNNWYLVSTGTIIAPRSNFAYTSFSYDNKFYFAVLGGLGYNQTGFFDFYL